MNLPTDQKNIQHNDSSLSRKGWILIVSLTLSGLIIGTIFKKPFSLESLLILLLWNAAILACIIPIIALAIWRGKPDRWRDIALALGVWLMNFSCLLLMNRLPIFGSLEWNWTGKGFAILSSLIFIGLWRGISWREIGFRGLKKGSWLPFVVLALVMALLGSRVENGPIKIDALLFQITMPAIDEEIVYRGILLALLDRAFGKKWKVLGANVGWGWVISSILFGLVHGIGFNHFQIQFSIVPIIFTGIGGLIIGWLRERTGSLYPAIVVHSIGDSIGYVITAFANGLA